MMKLYSAAHENCLFQIYSAAHLFGLFKKPKSQEFIIEVQTDWDW